MNNLYLDFDETIVESNISFLSIANKKFNTDKKVCDVKRWDYTDLFPITPKEVEDIYASDEFFSNLKFKHLAKETIDRFKEIFNIHVISKGTYQNLENKRTWINENIGDVEFTGIIIGNKNILDMSNGFFVDDRADNLHHSNAKIKILLKNENNFKWQLDTTDLYIVNNWKELEEFCSWDGWDLI